MYARSAWAQSPYAGTVLPAPNVGEIPPPIPGDPSSFSYSTQLGAYPWAYLSWAGGYPPLSYPGGGVLVHPLADSGVMQVRVWWPFATALQLVRITTDGTRTPVRGAYPLVVSALATRQNYATNPSLEAGLNGYVPDAGTPTLSQLADSAAPAGAYVLRATVAGAGSNGVTVPTSLLSPPAGQPVTVGWAMRLSAVPTSVTLTIGWTNAAGGALTASSVALTANQINESVAQWGRQVVTVTPPTGAVTPTVKITAGGMPAGGQMDLDAITIENGTTDGSAFDGNTLGGAWTGTADLSASVLAPVHTVLDGECPLDTQVRYRLAFPGITGSSVTSDLALLPSNRRSWLTHPKSPGAPIIVGLRRKPVLTSPVLQGVFAPINRRRKVVVSAPRTGYEGTIELNALNVADREALIAMFDDGSPVLLRSPSEYNFRDQWLALATTTEDPEGRLAYQDAWLLSAPYTEVDPPSVLA